MSSAEEIMNITVDIQLYPTKKYQCDGCIMYQEWLLEEGDGSQVLCTHMDDDDDDSEETPIMESSTDDTATDAVNSDAGETSTTKKRKRNNDDDDNNDEGITFPDDKTFHMTADNDIYIATSETHHFNRLDMQETQNISADWKDIPLNVTYVLITVDPEKSMYDDISDSIYNVQIITIRDVHGNDYRLLCPRAILEELSCFPVPTGQRIFLQKVTNTIVDWKFY